MSISIYTNLKTGERLVEKATGLTGKFKAAIVKILVDMENGDTLALPTDSWERDGEASTGDSHAPGKDGSSGTELEEAGA